METNTAGKNIDILCRAAGIKQTSMAQYLGIDQTSLSAIKRGKRKIKPEEITKTAALFHLTPECIDKQPISVKSVVLIIALKKPDGTELQVAASVDKDLFNTKVKRYTEEKYNVPFQEEDKDRPTFL